MRMRFLHACLLGMAAVALVTLIAYRIHLNTSSTGFLYLLLVMFTSLAGGFREASIVSLFAVNCLNYYFVPPVFSFRVVDPQDFVALATFEAAALVVSRLSTRLKAKEQAETRHRIELEKLYEFSRRILMFDRHQSAGSQIVSLLSEVFGFGSAVLFDAGAPRAYATEGSAPDLEMLARGAYLQGRVQDRQVAGTMQRIVRLGVTQLGALAVRGQPVSELTLDAIASLVALAMERARSFENESRAEAAKHAEQLRTAVLDALAHAFKSPLTAILVASSGLVEAGRLSAEDAELAELIDERAEHLNQLTSRLLEMARLDGADARLNRGRVQIHELMEELTQRLTEALRGHRVVSKCNPALDVYADRDLLGAALEQFLDNAAKYSRPGSVILIGAEESLGEVIISVHNEGPAIEAADRERIFDRFYRASDARHRASGTGLGLSIAKKIAAAHGGRTWVVSDEKSGTTFYLALSRGLKKREHEPVTGQSTPR